jgi:outer membrane protein assembly complex protein YaeT
MTRSASRVLGLVVLAALAIDVAACHEEGDIKVTSLTFTGNRAMSASDLSGAMATQSSGSLPWSTQHYFDRATFEADLKRLTAFYTDRGYPHARVTGTDVQFNSAHDAVSLAITIDEGAPLTVDDVRLEGFEVLSDDARHQLAEMALRRGQAFDRRLSTTSRDLALSLLLDSGYARATVAVEEAPATAADHVVITVRATPGPLSSFGPVDVVGLKSVGRDIVNRELAFKSGDLFRETLVRRTQRRLAGLELFEFVNVELRSADVAPGAPLPVRITVTESKPQKWTFSAGYGSEDKARASVQWTHLNFLGRARQMTFDSKWSSLDRGVRASLRQPYFLFPGLGLSVNGGSWWTYGLDYTERTLGGRVTLDYQFDSRLGSLRSGVRDTVSLAYVHEYVKDSVPQSVLDDPSRRSGLIAAGLNPDTGESEGTLASLDMLARHVAVDDPIDPHRGYSIYTRAQHAAPGLGEGTYRFDSLVLDARGYFSAGRLVFGGRALAGTVHAAAASDFPFSERFFLGGSTTLRGWGLYEVSPLDDAGNPIGGQSEALVSGEVRLQATGKLSFVGFIDAGNVGAGQSVSFSALRTDIGPGVRYRSIIGVIRLDYGYQLNPIPGLLIDGNLQDRRWRVHFGVGQSF